MTGQGRRSAIPANTSGVKIHFLISHLTRSGTQNQRLTEKAPFRVGHHIVALARSVWSRQITEIKCQTALAIEESVMKSALSIAILSLSICLPAHAYEVQTGAVMICDTQKQVERFAEIFDGNQQIAIRAVNSEENKPNACAIVDVSYVAGPKLGMARGPSHAFQVMPIVVVGVSTESGYAPVKPVLFFMPVEVKEFAV
jgi:methyl coenzyme M reductase subunit C